MNQEHFNQMAFLQYHHHHQQQQQEFFKRTNLRTSSRPTQMMPPQQCLRDTPPNLPPHSPSQASQSESSPVGKGKGKKPRPKKTDVTHTRLGQFEEFFLAETYIQISEDPRFGIDQTNKSFWGQVTGEYNRHAPIKHTNVVSKAVVPRRRVHTTKDIEEPNELFRDNTIPRPPGKLCSSSTSQKEAFKDMVQEVLRIERAKKLNFIDTQKIEDLKFLNFSTAEMKPRDVKDKQENDKIETKPDKNGKRGEAGKSQKQLQSIEQEKLKKMQELAEYINTPGWNRPAFCDDDDDDDVDYTIAITPILSTEEPVDSLSMGDKHLDTIPATESDEVIKSSVKDLVLIPMMTTLSTMRTSSRHHLTILVSLEAAEIVILEVEEIEDDNLREKLLNVYLLIANIEALKDNPTPSSKLLTKSSSTSFKSFLEETNTFHNSLPKFENFYLGEISSGSTTTHSDISLPNYEAFYFDDNHIKELSSGSTTTHSDISLSEYDSFVFDPSNDQFPPTDRSDFTHEEFVDELAHIISPPEYDCFYFRDLPDPGELMSILNSGIRENPSTTYVNLPIEDDHSPLLAYVVWIFLAYLTYPVIPLYLYSFGNEDTIFDPGITINHFFKPGLSHRCEAFKKFNTHRSHLNEWPMIINGKNITILDVLLFHFYPP
uniref:Uncharacterized protein n=1 Tax=Tanacetum cinerariifolium TaxID=118510 RepID=A0A6L2KAY8_TANCI|nr:hypothetical protein [Tanacetum cinerariifolium]